MQALGAELSGLTGILRLAAKMLKEPALQIFQTHILRGERLTLR